MNLFIVKSAGLSHFVRSQSLFNQLVRGSAILCVMLFLGCGSKEKTPNQSASTGQSLAAGELAFKQSGRATLTDKRQRKPMTFTWAAVSDGRTQIKMDFFGAFNTILGRFISGKTDQVLLHAEKKKAYRGKGALQRLVPVKVDASDLIAALKGIPLPEWKCQAPPSFDCQLSGGVRYRLLKSGTNGMEWALESDLFKLEVLTTSFQTMVEFSDEVFAIKIPEGYTL